MKTMTLINQKYVNLTVLKQMKTIKVLGTGCKNCKKLAEDMKAAITDAGLNVQFEYIDDIGRIMTMGVIATPAVIIDDKVVSSGRTLTKDEIKDLLNL